MPAAVFDQFAPDYDERFGGLLGQIFRRATWRWLDGAFGSGDTVLELSCGTGEDALHLAGRGVGVLATDASAGMIEVARRKVLAESASAKVELRRVSIEQIGTLEGEFRRSFDGAFANFGGLNLVADLPVVARSLGVLVRPGGRVVLCIMGPLVPWEWAWFLAKGDPARAFRRLAPGGAAWRGVTVRYPSIRRTRRAFSVDFRLVRASALGVLVPPPYTESWARRHPGIVAMLEHWERRIASWPLVPWLGDHYVLQLERR